MKLINAPAGQPPNLMFARGFTPENRPEDLTPFLESVARNIELARGAGVRGEVDGGIGLLRSTLRRVEQKLGGMVNPVYHDTLKEMVDLLQMKSHVSGGQPSVELATEKARLEEIQAELGGR